MSNEVIADVWKHATVSGGDLLVLLVLADAANDTERWTWESVKTIARKSRMTERNVYRCLDALRQLEIIEDVPEREWPPSARLYKSVVRRVRTPDFWLSEGGDNMSESSNSMTPDNLSPLTRASDNPMTITTSVLQTSSVEPGAPRRTRRKTGREKREEALAEEEVGDPAKAIEQEYGLGPSDPADEAEPEEPRQRPQNRRGSKYGPDSAMGLADTWVERLEAVEWGSGLDIANRKKLASAFSRWKKAGTTPDQIRAMIDRYATDPGLRSKGTVPWVDFLAKRALLDEAIKKSAQSKKMEENRFNEDYWG